MLLFPSVITLIFAGLSVAGAVFMLAFLNAMGRELGNDRARGIEECRKNGFILVTPERHQRQDRAA